MFHSRIHNKRFSDVMKELETRERIKDIKREGNQLYDMVSDLISTAKYNNNCKFLLNDILAMLGILYVLTNMGGILMTLGFVYVLTIMAKYVIKV